LPDSYILGEFLAEDNAPCYFHEFVAQAEAAGLEYLTDTDLQTALPGNTSPELHQLLGAMAGPDARMYDQYFDFFQGRQFRQSLLIKSDTAPGAKRTVDHRRIAHLHFGSSLRLVPDQSNGEALVLRDPGGPTITTNDPLVARALDHLGASLPETRNLRQLLDHLEVTADAERQAAAERVMAAILRVIIAGLGTMSAVPVKIGRAADARPKVWQVARHDRMTDQPWTTNLRHMPVKLDPVANAMLPMLDGQNDRAALTSHLGALVKTGRLDLDTFGGLHDVSGTGDDPVARLAARVELVLQQLEQLALLEPMQ
jgi:methyltransferase-like protein